jgi:cold-inducible RNA-binding protein
MSNKMYVGNLPFSATEADLRGLFSEFGAIDEVVLVMDRETGRPRGFGFVSMPGRTEMESAISGLNERDFQGRALVVNEAKERAERPRGNSGEGNRASRY